MGKGTTNRPSKTKPVDSKKLKSTTATVKKIKASLETKSKKKVYKKDKISDSDEDSLKDIKPLSIAEFSNVDELSKIFEVPSNSIIQKCMGLGVLATINQRLDWDIIELLAGEFGYQAEKLEDIGEELRRINWTLNNKQIWRCYWRDTWNQKSVVGSSIRKEKLKY